MTYTYSYSGADCKAYAWFEGSSDYYEEVSNILRETKKVKNTSEQLPAASSSEEQNFSENIEKVLPLNSLATISLSIHDAKAPVRRLGHVGVSGFTKAIRTIAGTMVFLIVEDHPLKDLAKIDPANSNKSYYFSLDENKGRGLNYVNLLTESKLSSLISKFNLMLVYQTEVFDEKTNNFSGASMIIKGIEITGESIVTSVNDMVTEVVIQFVAEDVVMFRKNIKGQNNEQLSIFFRR
jgi:hypothetical protein